MEFAKMFGYRRSHGVELTAETPQATVHMKHLSSQEGVGRDKK
jgi:hypothetical protein